MTFPPKVWDGVLHRLQAELSPHAVEAWLAPLVPEVGDSGLRLLCPSAFHRDHVRDHYLPRIVACAGSLLERSIDVELGVSSQSAPLPREPRPSVAPPREPPRPIAAVTRPQPTRVRQRPLPYSFESFVVGSCNALAREASLALAREQRLPLQQVYLSSGSGLGKTHLAHSVEREVRERGELRVLYNSAESFTTAFTNSIRNRRTDEFKRRYRRDCDLLVIEDVQFLQGKAATQLEFFHTVQHLLDVGGRVLVTGEGLPAELSGLDERLRSQLSGGFVAEIRPPDATVRRNILRDKAARGGVRLPDDCLDWLVESVCGSVRDLEGALIQVVATSSLLGRAIDLELAREALKNKLPGSNTLQRPDVPTVVRVVASFFRTTPESLARRSRRRDVLLPRQLAMYLCRRHTAASLAEIGAAFGRDHPAVRNAVRKVERLILERAPVRYQIESLSDRIEEQMRGGTG